MITFLIICLLYLTSKSFSVEFTVKCVEIQSFGKQVCKEFDVANCKNVNRFPIDCPVLSVKIKQSCLIYVCPEGYATTTTTSTTASTNSTLTTSSSSSTGFFGDQNSFPTTATFSGDFRVKNVVESKSSTETTVTISAQVENLTIVQICLSIISTLIGLTFICYKFKILCFRKKVEKDSDWIEQRELGFEKQRSARRLFPNHRVYPDLDQIQFDADFSHSQNNFRPPRPPLPTLFRHQADIHSPPIVFSPSAPSTTRTTSTTTLKPLPKSIPATIPSSSNDFSTPNLISRPKTSINSESMSGLSNYFDAEDRNEEMSQISNYEDSTEEKDDDEADFEQEEEQNIGDVDKESEGEDDDENGGDSEKEDNDDDKEDSEKEEDDDEADSNEESDDDNDEADSEREKEEDNDEADSNGGAVGDDGDEADSEEDNNDHSTDSKTENSGRRGIKRKLSNNENQPEASTSNKTILCLNENSSESISEQSSEDDESKDPTFIIKRPRISRRRSKGQAPDFLQAGLE